MARTYPLALLFAGLLAACGGGGGGGSSTNCTSCSSAPSTPEITGTGPGVLSVSPLATSTLFYATPLGNLAPPGHVLPTDHVYLYFVDPWSGNQQANDCSKRPVFAAGAGTVTFMLQTETRGDSKIMVQMTKTFMYYYDHVLALPNIKVGSRVAAGEQIATTTGFCPSIDLGVYDLDQTPAGYLNPARYGDIGAHPASPYKYFSEPLRTLYYSKIRVLEGVPANKDGRVDFGIRGRLSGDWFHSSIANSPSSVINGPDGWALTISFAYDWYIGSPRISVGGQIATAGLLATSPLVLNPGQAAPPATIDFGSVSTASGIVAYQGYPVLGGIGEGWMLVQMVADDRIKIEYFKGATTKPTAFTAAAQEYVR